MSISDRPIVRRRRWTHTSSRNSRQAAAESIFFFFAAAPAVAAEAAFIERPPPERSALRILGAPDLRSAIVSLQGPSSPRALKSSVSSIQRIRTAT